jgi:hypothetical protein
VLPKQRLADLVVVAVGAKPTPRLKSLKSHHQRSAGYFLVLLDLAIHQQGFSD